MLDTHDFVQIEALIVRVVTPMMRGLKEGITQEISEFREEVSDDMARLVMNVATKAELAEVREEIHELRENLNTFVISAEKTTGALADLQQEYAFVSVQLSRQAEWNYKVAEKLDIPFDY